MHDLFYLSDTDTLAIFEQVKDILADYHIMSVAEAAEVAPATLYFWLEGRTQSPHLRTIIKVASVLGYELRLVQAKPRLKLVA